MLLVRIAGYALVLAFVLALGIILGPGIPDRLNPFAQFDPYAEPNFLTTFKLDRATATPEQCFATLDRMSDLRLARMLDREVNDECHIREHTLVRGIGDLSLDPLSTRCQIVVRMALWEHHDLQPAAINWMGSEVVRLSHFGSYSCRKMRTGEGETTQMSAHSTASALDVSGFTFGNGQSIDILRGWSSPNDQEKFFLRAARNGACKWFKTVLSPDFNALHRDHFHLAQGRYGACR